MTNMFGTTLPIVQAPMAGVQGSALAAAVSNAGGLGSLPAALLSVEALGAELTAIRDQTRGPVNVNFFCHTPPTHRAALQSDEARHTALTNLFSGRAARGIVNRLMRELGAMSEKTPAFPLASGALAPLRAAAEQQGRGDFSPLWAGQNVSGCAAIPAAALTRALAGVGSSRRDVRS